ncbi:MAG: N-acetylneuraminate synthase family protein [Alphaproteobacteria bacterium]|nr:N-acetylneuraminate synthase family protein [Alphaproteobacteria bacterium]MDE2629779.1 N-acetylneuraminate synthase family protein [Alphaproteobacteria bacterium]
MSALRPVFIAEASSNHGRDLSRALVFVDAAAAAGCDAVKFQLFRIDRMFAPEILNHSAKHRARKDWELPLAHLVPLAERCLQRRIAFSCTPFYLEAVEELRPYVAFYKIASYELLVHDLLAACAATGKPIVLSTGMATMEEILQAVATLRQAGASDIMLLHCVSAYPAPVREANLSAITALREATGCKVGWSDHTRRPAVIERAIHRWGAAAVEFHLDLDGKGAEYADGHCWLPEEIAPVIARVREAFEADGTGFKEPQPAELADRDWRADPQDGMRPLRHVRAIWEPAA